MIIRMGLESGFRLVLIISRHCWAKERWLHIFGLTKCVISRKIKMRVEKSWSICGHFSSIRQMFQHGTHLKMFIIWSSAGPEEWIQPISLDLASFLLRWPCFSSTYSQRTRACSHLLLLVYPSLPQTHRLHMLQSFSPVCSL
jgi:hypothetical protein